MAETGTVTVEVISNKLTLIEKWYLVGVFILAVIQNKGVFK